jgi:hypothetical protein
VVKAVWSYLPFAWRTSFRTDGLPLNKNIFLLNNSKEIAKNNAKDLLFFDSYNKLRNKEQYIKSYNKFKFFCK